jgi:hypothetical protein
MLKRLLLVLLLGPPLATSAQTPPGNQTIAVGQTSSVQTATLTFTSATVASSPFTINVLKQGAVLLTVGTTALATAGQGSQLNYLPPQQLTLGGYIGGAADGIAVDGAGNVFIAELWGPVLGLDGEIAELLPGQPQQNCTGQVSA